MGVYEEGIDALLRRWDATKNVERDIYYGLKVPQKQLLLARIGFDTFIDNNVFFPQGQVSDKIVKFIKNFPGYENKIVDGDEVLRSIEAHHGILSQRAPFIYSFSHLTFQEYFAANEVVHDSTGITLFGFLTPETIASDRWREVILMAASLLQDPHGFFERFREALGEFIRGVDNILEMFSWADRKARQNFGEEELIAGRLHYLTLGLIFDIDRSASRERARLAQVALTRAEQFVELFNQELDIFRSPLVGFPMGLNKSRADNLALELDRAYDLPQELSITPKAAHSNLIVDLELTRLQFLTDLITYNVTESPRRALGPKFVNYCRDVRQRCDIPPNENIDRALNEISQSEGIVKQSAWVKFSDDLRADSITHQDVAYNWRLSTKHVESLSRIFRATKLMHDCLDVAVVRDPTEVSSHLFEPPMITDESL